MGLAYTCVEMQPPPLCLLSVPLHALEKVVLQGGQREMYFGATAKGCAESIKAFDPA